MFSRLIKSVARRAHDRPPARPTDRLSGVERATKTANNMRRLFRFIGADKYELVSIERAHDGKCRKLNGRDFARDAGDVGAAAVAAAIKIKLVLN